MDNPLDILFGPGVVSRLRKQPSALKRIAERVKPLLMAGVHPDKNPDAGPEAAAEISEAYQILSGLSPDELEVHVRDFLETDHQNHLRLELREAKVALQGFTQQLADKDREIRSLREQVIEKVVTGEDAWRWIASDALTEAKALKHLPRAFFPEGAVPRGMLYKYRLVVEETWEKGIVYRGYEFEMNCKVKVVITSLSLDNVRNTSTSRDSKPLKGVRLLRQEGALLLGSAVEVPDNILISTMVKNGRLDPFVLVGRHPIFSVRDKSYSDLESERVRDKEVKIIDIIYLPKRR